MRRIENIAILPITAIVLIVPLIVHMKVVPIESSIRAFWFQSSFDYDFFSYYKMLFTVILVSAALLLYALNVVINRNIPRKSNYYIPLVIYIIFVVLSTLFSQYKSIALFGFMNRYEGMLALLSYAFLIFLVINIVKNEEQIKLILLSLIISSFVIGLIGVFQYYGLDFFKSSLGKRIMLPVNYREFISGVDIKFGNFSIYSTLYNPNYVGSYSSMILMLCIPFIVFSKNRVYTLLAGGTACIMFANLIGCGSRAGLAGVLISTIFFVILAWRGILKNLKRILFFMLFITFIYYSMNTVSHGKISYNYTQKNINQITNNSVSQNGTLIDVVSEGNAIKIITSTEVLIIKCIEGKIHFEDDKGSVLALKNENGKFLVLNQRYKHYQLSYDYDLKILSVARGDKKLKFLVNDDRFMLLNNNGEPDFITPIEKIGFKGYEHFGSGRGYIWSRSLPLIKKTIFIGKGPDTFALYFPQNDYIGKLITFNDMGIIIDKPHNFYIQTAINTGVVSCTALIVMFVMYISKSIRKYRRKNPESFQQITGVGLLFSVSSYLMTSAFNDSVISVAPVFWVLFALGIYINDFTAAP